MIPTWKENPLFAGLLAALTIVLTLFVGLKAWNTYSEHGRIGVAPRSPDTIVIDGDGKVTGEPTLAEVSVGMYSDGRDVTEVQMANSKKVNAIIAALKGLGIASADMQTNNYSIAPKFDYKDGAQNVIGYVVSQNLSVKVRDLSRVGAVVAKAGELGANQVNGVTFTIDDPTVQKQQARMMAIEDAKKKAEELANALGVKIVRVASFSESSTQPPAFPYAYRALDAAAAAPIPEIQTGTLDVQSRVSVTFEIR
jgi:hypothetical protein